MSVTVRDLLKLPSLSRATLEAGQGGLGRHVSSISVLESAQMEVLSQALFSSVESSGGKIMITGFLNCATNESLQCALVERLSDMGAVGIVLFYVGVVVPTIGEKLKALCDAKDFALICMPENQISCRYSDVISEVMELVIRDRMVYMNLTNELLGELSHYSEEQRSVGMMMQLIANRLHISLLLTDSHLRILDGAVWPQQSQNVIENYLSDWTSIPLSGEGSMSTQEGGKLCRVALSTDSEEHLELFVYSAEKQIWPETINEVADLVRLAANLWRSRHVEVAVTELIRAILQDEPLKMRELANIFGIDVSVLETMGIIRLDKVRESEDIGRLSESIYGVLHPSLSAFLLGSYEGTLVLFTRKFNSLAEQNQVSGYVVDWMKQMELQGTLTWCMYQSHTSQAATAFRLHQNYIQDARRIFPDRRVFHLRTLAFAQSCRQAISEGEDNLQGYLRLLQQVCGHTEPNDMLHTLEVFLLDADGSHIETSRRLYLHKNTVKYRIGRCSDLAGFRIGSMPETQLLYQALAIRRLQSVPEKE